MYKLLIVDDEEIERRAIERIVSKSNIKITDMKQASNGQEAVAISSTYEPDIIIMDISMPGLDGMNAARVIKKFLPNVHVIFLTAFDEFDYAKNAITLGADDFLVKPAAPDVLIETICDSIKRIEYQKEQKHKSDITEEKLQGVSNYLKECFVETLISGKYSEKTMKKHLSFANIDFDYSYCSIISLDFNDEIVKSFRFQMDKQQKIFEKIKKELTDVMRRCILCVFDDRMTIFVYHTDYDSLAKSQSLLRDTLSGIGVKIFNEYMVKLKIGVGSICDSLDTVWRSFSEAKEQICCSIEMCSEEFIAGIINDLTISIIDNDRYATKEYALKLQDIMLEKTDSIEDYRTLLLELSIFLKQKIISSINRPIIINDALYIVTSKIKYTDEGTDYLLQYTKDLRNICAIDEKDKNAVIVDKMTKYIEEHITENILLEHLSEVSKLSSFYISKLFKKYLDMNFSDYLTYLRIRKAKEMLKNPYLSIKEISYQLGYTDPNYFTRVFKKEMDISPTKYRKHCLLDV